MTIVCLVDIIINLRKLSLQGIRIFGLLYSFSGDRKNRNESKWFCAQSRTLNFTERIVFAPTCCLCLALTLMRFEANKRSRRKKKFYWLRAGLLLFSGLMLSWTDCNEDMKGKYFAIERLIEETCEPSIDIKTLSIVIKFSLKNCNRAIWKSTKTLKHQKPLQTFPP